MKYRPSYPPPQYDPVFQRREEDAIAAAINGLLPVYNARDYVRGDGSNETVGLQAVLTAAGNDGGGLVFAPRGTYGFTPFLSIPANVTLMGAGRGVTIFSRLAPRTGDLFSIRLAGNRASLRGCSVKGCWDPANPTTQTYDTNVGVFGDSVQHCTVFDVESYNAHIGFLVGGIVGDPTESFAAQSHNRFIACYAHDTYDLGFGLIAKDATDAGTCIGCQLIGCWQNDSYATAGLEIRFQRAAQVLGFNARNNTNSSLGAGIRLESALGPCVTNLQTSNCYMGLQAISDTTDAVIAGHVSRNDYYAAFFRNAADCTYDSFTWLHSLTRGGELTYLDGSSWTHNNENLTFADGQIITPQGFGLYVKGAGQTESALADNGKGLVVNGVRVRNGLAVGIYIEAGGNFALRGCTLQDNATAGITVASPAPGGVADTTKPAGGVIDDCTFITTGTQTNPLTDTTGAAGARLTAVGRLHLVGYTDEALATDIGYTSTEPLVGTFTARGNWEFIRTISASESPYALRASDTMVRCNATAGAITINLPTAASSKGKRVTVKKTDSSGNAVTVTPNGVERIDGAATYALAAQYKAVTLYSGGSDWAVVATV